MTGHNSTFSHPSLSPRAALQAVWDRVTGMGMNHVTALKGADVTSYKGPRRRNP